MLGILLSTVVLAYFYAADTYYFSTKSMAQIFQFLLMVNDFQTAWLSLGICIMAACWKNPAPIESVVDFAARHEFAVAATTVVLLAVGSVLIYQNNAFSMDEYAAVFQAEVFATGKLTAQLPHSVVDWLIPPGFNGAFLIASRTTGQAMEAYWPGFALLLTPFTFIGAPWLCNACVSGLAVFLVYRITNEISGDRRAAGWAVIFTVASGAFVADGISYYSMQSHLTANLLFAWLLLNPSRYRAFGAGVVGSFALVLHNPFPHTMFAVPWIIAIGFSKEQRRCFTPLILGYLPILILVGAGWLDLREIVTAGDSGFNVISNNLNGAFSIPDKAMIDMRVAALVKMWIWAVPCLFLFALLGRLRCGDDWRVRLMAQSAVLTFAGYLFFIFDQGHGWGYRYFHSAWGVVPILAGCAMTKCSESQRRLAAFAGATAILNLLLVVPLQMMQIDKIITRHLEQLPKPRRPGNDVYFVRADRGFYLPDLVQMDPMLRTQDLILFSRGPEMDAELRRQNWPGATLAERGFGIEEWNLGPTDQRHRSHDSHSRFEFGYSNHAPTGDVADPQAPERAVH